MDLQTVGQLEDAYRNAEISKAVHPDDVMHKNGSAHYDIVGRSAVKIILNGLGLSWTQRVRGILDLPCGHGRVARHLRAAFPSSTFYFCDLDSTGADFCSKQFDGTAIYSRPDLTAVALPDGLDLIWVGSLFTHVDAQRTERWLAYLARHLAEHGILVATFHGLFFPEVVKSTKLLGGADWSKITSEYNANGFGYSRYAGADMGDYGISLSKASRVMDIATSIPDTRVLSYTERGWGNHHDVLILTRHDRLKPFT